MMSKLVGRVLTTTGLGGEVSGPGKGKFSFGAGLGLPPNGFSRGRMLRLSGLESELLTNCGTGGGWGGAGFLETGGLAAMISCGGLFFHFSGRPVNSPW